MVDATIARISGPVAVAKDLEGAHMFDVVRIGQFVLLEKKKLVVLKKLYLLAVKSELVWKIHYLCPVVNWLSTINQKSLQ